MSTRNAGRHVRQRKLNTKQPLRIIREDEIEDQPEDEALRHIPQVETGVEKGEEIEFHLQAVINAANAATAGAKSLASYIPTPEASRARGVDYDKLYPKDFSQPATYIRFSSTVEDCIGSSYCMNDDDVAFLAQLNDGKDVNGRERKDKLSQCSEDTFEEVMSFFEETNQRIQPFANIDNAPVVSLQEMEQSIDETVSQTAVKWFKPIYAYWVTQKGSRSLMPAIKVRIMETASDGDDADPYVCFRRREVRQTRKTRGRDAQVVEKLKKLRLELEQARSLVQMVVQRENLNKDQLEISRKVFEQRGQLKRVKIEKGITSEKGDDEELLINQKPIQKPKPRQSTTDQRPGPTIRLRTNSDRPAPDNDLLLLEDSKAEAQASVEQQIQNRKVQHRRWNEHWQDHTWAPITPPLEPNEKLSGWGFLEKHATGYPTPPPTLPSEGSQKDGDAEMTDVLAPLSPPKEPDIRPAQSAEPDIIVTTLPGAYPPSPAYDCTPACRLRKGRSNLWYLEARKPRKPQIYSGVITDPEDSDDEDMTVDLHPINERILFDYRCALNRSSAGRQEVGPADRRPVSSSDGVSSVQQS
ncbi:hypothetical protein AMS68_004671 [Peltaster fructicola]|uniref:Enhancer of polycomb-like protein n=1 Tax=Peltaster fructicola TaxID=286661 RepID=A0A6H0XWQ4_9PEZI|nr:hypothetical protein AMS68_004671 [Peltaster fructicola]